MMQCLAFVIKRTHIQTNPDECGIRRLLRVCEQPVLIGLIHPQTNKQTNVLNGQVLNARRPGSRLGFYSFYAWQTLVRPSCDYWTLHQKHFQTEDPSTDEARAACGFDGYGTHGLLYN
jgi:hypothetical protein